MRIAESAGVRWSFRTARGQVARELLAQAKESDLVSLGVRGRSPRRGPGSSVEALLENTEGPVLVLRRGMRLGRRVHVLYDGTPSLNRVLEPVLPLLRSEGAELNVLVRVRAVDREQLEAEVREHLLELDLKAELAWLSPAAVPLLDLATLLRQWGCGLLIATREHLLGDRRELGRLLARLECPVLVIG